MSGSYRLTIQPLGVTIAVAPQQTLLEAAHEHSITLPHVCQQGLCGTCKVQIQSGHVDHGDASDFALLDIERDEGKTLACCATLLTDTVIEVELD